MQSRGCRDLCCGADNISRKFLIAVPLVLLQQVYRQTCTHSQYASSVSVSNLSLAECYAWAATVNSQPLSFTSRRSLCLEQSVTTCHVCQWPNDTFSDLYFIDSILLHPLASCLRTDTVTVAPVNRLFTLTVRERSVENVNVGLSRSMVRQDF